MSKKFGSFIREMFEYEKVSAIIILIFITIFLIDHTSAFIRSKIK